jgi:hypothetical protein
MKDKKNTNKQVKRFKKKFGKYSLKIAQYYGPEKAQQIERQTFDEYVKLLPEAPRFPGKFNIYNSIISLNVLLVAFYKAMVKYGHTVKETIRIAYEVFEDSNAIPPFIRWVPRTILCTPFFRFYINYYGKIVSKHPEGWKIKYKKGDGKSSDLYFECHECGVIKYCKANDADELSKYCNCLDYVQSRIFGLGMSNPQNIGQGDRICCGYMKKGRATIVPDNLSEILDFKFNEEDEKNGRKKEGNYDN